MTVVLERSDRARLGTCDSWCAVTGTPVPGHLPADRQLVGLDWTLEEIFDETVEEWWNLGQALGQEPSAGWAHAPACVTNASDLGLMLAWTRLVERWAADEARLLVLCDDPWLFRHLANRPGVIAGRPPPLRRREWRLFLRGLLARTKAAIRLARTARALAHQRKSAAKGASAILVYGHPASTAAGEDAYFGPLLREVPKLIRMLHVDAPLERAQALGKDGRTLSLHAWGSPRFARSLWKLRWKPVFGDWLVRRAAALEGGTGQAALIAWQNHCHRAWLAEIRPKAVAWPWENHAWERDFVRAARTLGVATLGYQHATVGWREWNYAPHSNPDGAASLPDRILTVGPADLGRLSRYGCPRNRLAILGALRYSRPARPPVDPQAPVFVPLTANPAINDELLDALRPLAAAGRQFLVKPHPLAPYPVPTGKGFTLCTKRLGEIEAISAVLYCVTTVGLEAVLAGLPTLRFRPRGVVAVDILPEGVTIPTAGADELAKALTNLTRPPSVPLESVFAPAEIETWRTLLGGGA